MPDRCDIPEFDRCEIGRDAHPHSFREVGIGTRVVASIWLAFCFIASVHSLVTGNWNRGAAAMVSLHDVALVFPGDD
jgi:hypothetical protein